MDLQRLIEELGCVKRAILYGQSKNVLPEAGLHKEYERSAENLFHYLVLRSFDLRPFQHALSQFGLSALGTAEGYVLENLRNVIHHLKRMAGNPIVSSLDRESLGYEESRDMLDKHTKNLFGPLPSAAKTKIMVTLPTEAAFDETIILKMAQNGMDIVRINLGHDDELVWLAMVTNVQSVSRRLGRSIKIYMDLAGPKIRIGPISYQNGKGKERNKLRVQEGEHLLLTKELGKTVKSKFTKNGEQVQMAQISVSLPQIIDDVAIGDPILFDDGMVVGKILAKNENSCEVIIEKCFKPKLGSEKGINLPRTQLHLPALTPEDIQVLSFACKHADILGYSFVRNEHDVEILYKELDALGAKDIGVVFKIENQEAFENFPGILLKGMKRNKIGVMIARGDLAVELGFERISEVQRELLWICEAAHVPVIWATQVLETLAKKGIPTRAEISDAAQGARAECVMLNKGPHIQEAIRTLRNILDKMDGHMSKKKDALRALNIAKNYMKWQDQKVSQNY